MACEILYLMIEVSPAPFSMDITCFSEKSFKNKLQEIHAMNLTASVGKLSKYTDYNFTCGRNSYGGGWR